MLYLELRTDDLLQIMHVRSLHNPQHTMCMKQSSFLFLHTLHDSPIGPKDVQLGDFFKQLIYLPFKHMKEHFLVRSRQVMTCVHAACEKPPVLVACTCQKQGWIPQFHVVLFWGW